MSQSPDTALATNRLEEWKIARDVLKGFDNNLHDIRKYGFTVAAALLALNSFLLPSSIGGKDALNDQVKLAAIGSLMLLIVALTYIERNYRLFLDAAATRARNLERVMNFELTEKIAGRSKKSYEMAHADLVYFFFLVAVFAVGLAVVSPSLSLTFSGYRVLGVSAAFSILFLLGSVIIASPAPSRRKSVVARTNLVRSGIGAVRAILVPNKILATPATPAQNEAVKMPDLPAPSFVPPKHSTIRRSLVVIFFTIGVAILALDLGVFYEIFHLPGPGLWILIALFSFFSAASWVMILIPTRLSLTKRTLDWTVDRLQCRAGETINVTVTNLGEDLGFSPSSTMFWAETQEGSLAGSYYKLPSKENGRFSPHDYDESHDNEHIWLGEWESYVWPWKTEKPGTYRIVRYKLDDKGRPVWKPLQRTFTVTGERHRFQITTSDDIVHSCELTGSAEMVFQEESYGSISCNTHNTSIASCLSDKMKVKSVSKIAS